MLSRLSVIFFNFFFFVRFLKLSLIKLLHLVYIVSYNADLLVSGFGRIYLMVKYI